MSSYYLFATLISEYGVDVLSAGLVREGFKIQPAGPLPHPKFLVSPGDISCLGSWHLEIQDAPLLKMKKEETTVIKSAIVLECVQRILDARKIPWHSLVIFSPNDGATLAWSGSNFKVDQVVPKSALERISSSGEDIG